MTSFNIRSIGKIYTDEKGRFIKIDPPYIPALEALDGFTHINVIWWFSECDSDSDRDTLVTERPYKKGPRRMGIFSTSSPHRPNPIALSTAEILHVNHQNGEIQIAYIDANDNTPVLDLKPYTPSLDRIETPAVPEWCRHWPRSSEESADFDWDQEFNFQGHSPSRVPD